VTLTNDASMTAGFARGVREHLLLDAVARRYRSFWWCRGCYGEPGHRRLDELIVRAGLGEV